MGLLKGLGVGWDPGVFVALAFDGPGFLSFDLLFFGWAGEGPLGVDTVGILEDGFGFFDKAGFCFGEVVFFAGVFGEVVDFDGLFDAITPMFQL